MNETSEFDRQLTACAADAGITVDVEWLRPLRQYYELLRHWNQRINLTALPLEHFPAATLNRLLVEPLVAAAELEHDEDKAYLDLGSGGGSPAIPIKIACPRLALTMVESRERKAAFLQECIRQLGLDGAAVLARRFEEIDGDWESRVDLMTLRAVRVDPALQALIGRLLRPGGRLFAFGVEAHQFSTLRLAGRLSLPGLSVLTILQRPK